MPEKWLLQCEDKDGRMVYFEREIEARYDETSPRVDTLAEAYAVKAARLGRYGWRYLDSGEWERAQVKAVRLSEFVGTRYFKREW